MVPAACYIRVSTEEQTEYSPDAQRRALERYAAQHGYKILPQHVYVDAGLSGRRADKRPAFLAMIAAAKGKPPPFAAILVHKFDRFARNREDSIVYKSLLRRQCGVQVISITEHLEDDRMSLILEAMLEAMAEYYSVNLAEEVRKGMVEKARRGELQTAPPFGYTTQNNALVPLPQEAAVVEEIYRRFLSGQSMAAIARWTRQAGALTHRGNPLDTRRVRYILSNPTYTGLLPWRPEREGPPLLVPGGHPPLVSPEAFRAAARRLKENAAHTPKGARPPGQRKHWLAGLVRCAACGGGLIFSSPRYLKCGRYAKGKCPCSQHVPAQALEEALLARLRADTALSPPLIGIPLAQDQSRAQALQAQALAALEKKLARLREAYLCGAESPQEYKAQKQALQAQARELRQAADPPASQSSFDPAPILATLQDPAAGTDQKHRAARAILETCTWDKAAATLTLVYRDPARP